MCCLYVCVCVFLCMSVNFCVLCSVFFKKLTLDGEKSNNFE